VAPVTLEDVAAFVDERIAAHDEHIARAIGAALRAHSARPAIERALLEVAYGTVTAVSASQVFVALDADPDVPVPMFSAAVVAIGERVGALMIPPSSGLVLGSLSGIPNTLTIPTTASQDVNAFEILDPDAAVLVSVGTSGYVDLAEQTTPVAPAANFARLYARDNGAGKTQLVVLFSSGAVQVLATQP
jgi:hypothetical protein